MGGNDGEADHDTELDATGASLEDAIRQEPNIVQSYKEPCNPQNGEIADVGLESLGAGDGVCRGEDAVVCREEEVEEELE